jgi:hypothetical protein
MKAVRENKEYTITEDLRQHYKDSGFDIYDDEGNLIEYSRGKTVSIEEHLKALDRIAELESQLKVSEKPEKEGKK